VDVGDGNGKHIPWQCTAWREIGQAGIIAGMSTAVPKKEKHPALVRFGNAVRARRKELGYSQEAFADVVALDRGYTGGVERGSHNITLLNILKIIDKLEMSHSEFFAVFDEGPDEEGDAAPARAKPKSAKVSGRTRH